MGLSLGERTIGIAVPSIYCDGCQTSLNLLAEMNRLTIERSKRPPNVWSSASEGSFIVSGLPITEEAAMKVAETRGWRQEIVHSRAMLFCPQCVEKPNAG